MHKLRLQSDSTPRVHMVICGVHLATSCDSNFLASLEETVRDVASGVPWSCKGPEGHRPTKLKFLGTTSLGLRSVSVDETGYTAAMRTSRADA